MTTDGMQDITAGGKEQAQALYEATVAALNERYELVYVDYRDQLSDRDVQDLLNGDADTVYDRFDEGWLSENRSHGATYEVEQITTEEERNLLEEHGRLDDLRLEIENRDESDPVRDMWRNTPHTLMTVKLDHDVPDYTLRPDDEFDEILAEIANAAGIDLDGNRDALTDLLANASYGGQLLLIWHGDAEDAIGATKATWTDPHLLILNSFNGSGFDAQVKGAVTRDLKPGDITVDKVRAGYSWHQTACPHPPAYATTVEFEKPTAPEQPDLHKTVNGAPR
ncbi:hypothetical protein KBX50_08305 [Micromonospora sp. C51]|uniref:hypothetical protein n=1 Tax=Micromonospora sp. C51 TaxID=2824879 RepID=UPI001B382DA9|nr:hypothetical protein [Micromonospora sp. C51]MBQ1048466.1 hypothetical protein [Micromonospora sp. C51]